MSPFAYPKASLRIRRRHGRQLGESQMPDYLYMYVCARIRPMYFTYVCTRNVQAASYLIISYQIPIMHNIAPICSLLLTRKLD